MTLPRLDDLIDTQMLQSRVLRQHLAMRGLSHAWGTSYYYVLVGIFESPS